MKFNSFFLALVYFCHITVELKSQSKGYDVFIWEEAFQTPKKVRIEKYNSLGKLTFIEDYLENKIETFTYNRYGKLAKIKSCKAGVCTHHFLEYKKNLIKETIHKFRFKIEITSLLDKKKFATYKREIARTCTNLSPKCNYRKIVWDSKTHFFYYKDHLLKKIRQQTIFSDGKVVVNKAFFDYDPTTNKLNREIHLRNGNEMEDKRFYYKEDESYEYRSFYKGNKIPDLITKYNSQGIQWIKKYKKGKLYSKLIYKRSDSTIKN